MFYATRYMSTKIWGCTAGLRTIVVIGGCLLKTVKSGISMSGSSSKWSSLPGSRKSDPIKIEMQLKTLQLPPVTHIITTETVTQSELQLYCYFFLGSSNVWLQHSCLSTLERYIWMHISFSFSLQTYPHGFDELTCIADASQEDLSDCAVTNK